MTTYTDVFGSDTVPPAEQGYAAIALTADSTLEWPEFYSGTGDTVAAVMDVTPDAGGRSILLPDATKVSVGRDMLFRNLGAFSFSVKDSTGTLISTVAAGAAHYIYLTVNSTAAGSWGLILFGVGTSSVDAATLIGYGIKAIGASLNQSHPTSISATDLSIGASYRAKTVIGTAAGTSTVSLTSVVTLGDDFFFFYRNAGAGTATIDPAGAELIDGQSTLDVQPGESLILVCSGAAWYSVGYGRSMLYQFTQLTYDVSAGGPFTLSASEASNKLITFIGNPGADVIVYAPQVVAVYYLYNNLSTAYSINFKTTAGAGVGIIQSQRVIAICDGTLIVSAQTLIASTSISLVNGSAAAPALNFASSTNTGFFLNGANGLGIAIAGVAAVLWDDSGNISLPGDFNIDINSGKITLDAATGNFYTAGSFSSEDPRNTQQALQCYILPSMDDGCRGYLRAGFDWWSRNQQWGGPFGFMGLVDGATGTAYNGEAATGYIDVNDSGVAIGAAAGQTWRSQGFKVPETQTVAAIWLKLLKVGNPTANFSPFIYTDSGGAPSALHTNGTATAQSGKLHTSDSNGAWYRFPLATPPTLTGGTQYHVVMKSSAATDGSNYWKILSNTASKYPFGGFNTGDGTPTWSANAGYAGLFLIELSATAQTLQASGVFDGKLQFGGSGASGTLTMSRGLCSSIPLHELLDTTENTNYLVGTALTKDATFYDAGYGEDHDRIVVRSNVTTGYAQIDVYSSAGTKTTVTATATDLSSGNHSVGWYVRAKNDGADRVDLFVDGTTYSSGTTLSIPFDKEFSNLGTIWIGGGFALAPTWTQKLDMSVLPSAAGWTWTGTGTEANCMSIQGGKLFQNKNGYASTDTGYYSKATLSLSNANGWAVSMKASVKASPNTKDSEICFVNIQDDTTATELLLSEYYFQSGKTTTPGWTYPQMEGKSYSSVFQIVAKASNYLLFRNRKLAVDGSGKFAGSGTGNKIDWGDASATAGENADVIYSYLAYYNTAWNPPQFTSGSISEFASWSGNQKALWPLLYNGGTFISAKALLGIRDNYLDKSSKIPAKVQRGITSGPTSASASQVLLPEMERFCIGEVIDVSAAASYSNSGAHAAHLLTIAVDGALIEETKVRAESQTATEYFNLATGNKAIRTALGLHKIEAKWFVGSGTGTSDYRNLSISAKV